VFGGRLGAGPMVAGDLPVALAVWTDGQLGAAPPGGRRTMNNQETDLLTI